MLMVIFYHSFYCYVGWENTIYSASISVGLWTIMSSFFSHIHVPTFLFLAGYLYAYKRFDLNSYPSKSSYLKNRIKRIGVPYLLWGAILMILQDRPLSQFFDGIAHLWFLLLIAECSLMFCLIDKVFVHYKKNVVVLIVTMLYLAIDNTITLNVNIAGLNVFIHYFPYYLMGILIHQINFHGFLCRTYSFWLVLFVFIGYLLSVRIGYFANFTAMLLIVVVFLYTKRFSKEWHFFRPIDKASMGIYILHQPLIQEVSLLGFVSNFRDEHYYTYPLLMFVFAFVVSYAIVYVTGKFKIDKVLFG